MAWLIRELLAGESGTVKEEVDPTIKDWAKADTKPTYTAEEVGALPDDTEIPTKTSQLINDSEFQTKSQVEAVKIYSTNYTDTIATRIGNKLEVVSDSAGNAGATANDAKSLAQNIVALSGNGYTGSALETKINQIGTGGGGGTSEPEEGSLVTVIYGSDSGSLIPIGVAEDKFDSFDYRIEVTYRNHCSGGSKYQQLVNMKIKFFYYSTTDTITVPGDYSPHALFLIKGDALTFVSSDMKAMYCSMVGRGTFSISGEPALNLNKMDCYIGGDPSSSESSHVEPGEDYLLLNFTSGSECEFSSYETFFVGSFDTISFTDI